MPVDAFCLEPFLSIVNRWELGHILRVGIPFLVFLIWLGIALKTLVFLPSKMREMRARRQSNVSGVDSESFPRESDAVFRRFVWTLAIAILGVVIFGLWTYFNLQRVRGDLERDRKGDAIEQEKDDSVSRQSSEADKGSDTGDAGKQGELAEEDMEAGAVRGAGWCWFSSWGSGCCAGIHTANPSARRRHPPANPPNSTNTSRTSMRTGSSCS